MPYINLNKEPIIYKRSNLLEYTHFRYEKGLDINYHSHDDTYEIFFFLDGKCKYSIEGKLYDLQPGDILIISNKLVHTSMPNQSRPYERIVLSIGPVFLKEHFSSGICLCNCFERAAGCNNHAIKLGAGKHSVGIYQCLAKLEEEIKSDAELSDIMIDSFILQLMVYLNRAYTEFVDTADGINVNSNEITDSIIQYINANIAEDLSLETLSAKFFISKYHLSREFKRFTGCTVHSFILKKRLIMAKELLREQNNIMDVSLNCGFGDYSNFVRTFKKEYGITPYQYMNPFKVIK